MLTSISSGKEACLPWTLFLCLDLFLIFAHIISKRVREMKSPPQGTQLARDRMKMQVDLRAKARCHHLPLLLFLISDEQSLLLRKH